MKMSASLSGVRSLIGSPTSVEKMFAPEESEKQVYLEGTAKEKADKLVALLTGKKII